MLDTVVQNGGHFGAKVGQVGIPYVGIPYVLSHVVAHGL